MGFENESKWVLSSENDSVSEKLGYSHIVPLKFLSDGEIISRLSEFGIDDVASHTLDIKDIFYLPSENFSADLANSLKLRNSCIYSGENEFLRLVPCEDNNYGATGLMNLIRDFASDSESPDFVKQLRFRTELKGDTISYLVTGKRKRGIGDSDNLEEEVTLIEKPDFDFLSPLGYILDPSKNKRKIQTKFGGKYKGIPINVEYTQIEEIPGITFLEIEMTPTRHVEGLNEILYNVSRVLGVENPSLTVENGGRLENRIYQKLQQELRK